MANRYWVGGTGTWDNTTSTNWSATDGGAGGATPPSAVDDVFFTVNSGNGFTCTIGTAGATCRNITISGLNTSGMTLAGTGLLSVYGSFSLPSTRLTWTHSGTLNFQGSSNAITKNITTNGVTITSIVVIGGTAGTAAGTDPFVLQSAFTCTGSSVTHTTGTFNLNGYTLTATTYASSNSNTRTLAFGTTGIINLSGTGIVWNTATLSGLARLVRATFD